MKTYCKPLTRGVSWRSQNFGDTATKYGPHSGNDEACNVGTPVYAAGDGVIEWAGEFDSTYHDNLLWLLDMGGNVMVLNCGDDEPSFIYAHLLNFTVKAGSTVRKGQIVAFSGNSGYATTGAHLHVECVPPGYTLNSPLLGRVNPDTYLTEWPEDVNAELQEDDFMAGLTEQQQKDIYWILCTPEGREFLANLTGQGAARHTLNTPIPRGGDGAGIGDGMTTLGAVVAWADHHTINLMAKGIADKTGTSTEDVKRAMVEVLESGTVKVEYQLTPQ